MSEKFDYVAIEPDRHDNGVNVYGFGRYPRSSVNYGMDRKVFLDAFNSVEEAVKAYPKAEVSEGIRVVESDPGPFAPGWFDPSAAGEC